MGLRYEKKVHAHFSALHDGYIASPWFRYTTDDEPRRQNYAQPDGLIIDVEGGRIYIIEVKYNHCAEAYFQLVDKYLPIVRLFFNNSEMWTFLTCEVVYWYDCHTAFPTQPKLRENVLDTRPGELGVHVWRP